MARTKKLVSVFRYENPIDKLGVYNSELLFTNFNDKLFDGLSKHTRDVNRPIASKDFPYQVFRAKYHLFDRNIKYGCTSIEELKAWFRGLNSLLLRCGFVLVEYKVTEQSVIVGHSGLQCLFNAKRVIERKVVKSLKPKFVCQ